MIHFAEALGLIVAAAFCAIYLKAAWIRSKVDSTIQLQCGSGDHEVMVVNINRYRGESKEKLSSRLSDSWQIIQDRRDFNHARYEQIKAEALAEKQAEDQKEGV